MASAVAPIDLQQKPLLTTPTRLQWQLRPARPSISHNAAGGTFVMGVLWPDLLNGF